MLISTRVISCLPKHINSIYNVDHRNISLLFRHLIIFQGSQAYLIPALRKEQNLVETESSTTFMILHTPLKLQMKYMQRSVLMEHKCAFLWILINSFVNINRFGLCSDWNVRSIHLCICFQYCYMFNKQVMFCWHIVNGHAWKMRLHCKNWYLNTQ